MAYAFELAFEKDITLLPLGLTETAVRIIIWCTPRRSMVLPINLAQIRYVPHQQLPSILVHHHTRTSSTRIAILHHK